MVMTAYRDITCNVQFFVASISRGARVAYPDLGVEQSLLSITILKKILKIKGSEMNL